MAHEKHEDHKEQYLLGQSLAEQERLRQQPQQLEAEARWLLDRLGIQHGWRALDMGCGPRGILDLLAERVGAQGRVVGLDRDEASVRLASAFAAERGLANVEVVHGDARASGLPQESFDVAHMRLVLVNVPEPDRVVAALTALVRPGGVVAVHEADYVSHFCEPPVEAWSRLFRAYATYARDRGIDLHVGRRVPALLRAAGVMDIQVNPVVHVYPPGHPRRPIFLQFVENVRERLVGQGLLRAGEVTDLVDSVRCHLDDPRTLVVSHLFFQVWGRKPGRV